MIPTLTSALFAAVAALAVGTAAFWSNPKRAMNRLLAITSFALGGWLLLLHVFLAGDDKTQNFRLLWIGLGLVPIVLWYLQDTIAAPAVDWRSRVRRSRWWWAFPCFCLVLALSPSLLVADVSGNLVYQKGHYLAVFAGILVQGVFAVRSWRLMSSRMGASRLDLQLLALGGVPTGCLMYLLMGMVSWQPGTAWERLVPLALVALWGGTVWSLLTMRLLNARHIVTIGLEKAVLVSAVAVFMWGIQQLAEQFIPLWLSIGLSVALGLWFAAEARPWLQQVSQRKAQGERLRQAAVDIARRELRPEAMEAAFCELLRDWAQCDKAVILMSSHGRLVGQGFDWGTDDVAIKLLHRLRWVTPERLKRERTRLHGDRLAELLEREQLGALAVSAGPSLSFAVGVGVPMHRRPFNFTEVGQLIGLEGIIENALSRAHYLMKAQHADQLATVGLLGASIAHEIRNPLVSIKTFVQLLPARYQDPVFREKFFRLIGEEVGRIDRLTEQLLDLSSPRVFSAREVSVSSVLAGCVDLISAKAEDKGVEIVTDYKAVPGVVYTDPTALKQVVLNLGFNAIQALERWDGEKKLLLSTSQVPEGVAVTIEDTGPGISSEIWERLFQPFQTTKSSGFGLGLAICKDILSSLQASITADQPEPGRGAVFRILLPCQPPTS